MPVIGVPLRYSFIEGVRPILYLGERVRRTLQNAGAEVVGLVPVQDVDYINTRGNDFEELTEDEKKIINKNLDNCDGLFLPGGKKFTPYDRYILEYAIEKHIPTLGICLSMQMMSCYNEDIDLIPNDTYVNHNQGDDDLNLVHKVTLDKNSKLYSIIGSEEIMVNSFHNYHSSENGVYNSVGFSEDGMLEAIEYPGDFFNIGIQWHPEISYSFDENSKKIIDYFVMQASVRESSREKEQEFVII